MINRYLNDYYNFKCIADKCPDTCCGPWEIEVDEASWERYLKLYNQGNELMRENLDIEKETFRQRADGRCAFLREDGLCKMILELGEESICRTCDSYPRHIEEFLGVREHSVSLSCPVAARDFLASKDKLEMTESIDDVVDTEEYEDFDGELFDLLIDVRSKTIDYLQNESAADGRKLQLKEKFEAVLDFVYNIQDALDDGDFEWIDEAMDAPIPPSESDDEHRYYSELRAVYNILFDMDILNPDFADVQKKAYDAILDKGEDFFLETEAAFEAANPGVDSLLEKITTYFFYTYFCGAIYDGYVYAQGAQAVFNALVIKVMWIYEWTRMTGGETMSLGIDRMADILYKHSRELENCVGNQIVFEKRLDEMV